MAIKPRRRSMRSGLFLFLLPCAFLVAVASFLSGCSQPSPRGGRSETMISPQPPPFLNGPVAVLLTNAHGFSAHVAMQTELGPSPEITSGQLLGRGDFLLFLPSYPEKWQKSLRAAGLSFLWNVGEGHGFVLSEALQAWAPMSSGYLATNVIVAATNPVPEKVDGRLCG